ncbi:MAG: HisS family protein [Chloroflexota bacterium]|nr:HisS family protein [Chloroflexota bacterium]
MQPVTRLRGMFDLPRESWLRKSTLQDSLTALISGYGYQFLETPLLEGTELFLRQSGGDLASRMYSFVDAGSHQVSLRPEFTSPIMRHYLENAGDLGLPARLQYAGPVFRFDVAHPEGSGQFTQVGAELIGSDSVIADAELVTLAARIPSHAGLEGCCIELADLDVFHSVLSVCRISDRARGFILASVPQLRAGPGAVAEVREKASQLYLRDRSPENQELSAALSGLNDDQARQVVQGFLQWNSTDVRRFGQRDPEQVVDRFLRKLKGSDDAGQLERALELASSLACIRGGLSDAIPAARQVVQGAGASVAPLDRLSELVDILEGCPETRGNAIVDFGLARGLAYYNGIVFEVRHPGWDGPLGGGGRYDSLARALGSPADVPALGFAYTLETLLSLSDWQGDNCGGNGSDRSVLVSAESSSVCSRAFEIARQLRGSGVTVKVHVQVQGLQQAMQYAAGGDFGRVIYVDSSGEQAAYDVE